MVFIKDVYIYTVDMNCPPLYPQKQEQEHLGKNQDTIIPSFLSKEATLKYFEAIVLSEREKLIIGASFRTRTKIEGNILHFQFKIFPSSLSEEDVLEMENISDALRSKLVNAFPEETIAVTIKVSGCCHTACFGCEEDGGNIG